MPAAPSAEPTAADDGSSTCPSPSYSPIYGLHVVKPVNDLPRVIRPFGDVGVDYGPPAAGAALPSRLDVIAKLPGPNPTLSPPSAAYMAAISADIDFYRQLAAGAEPHVARVSLERFRQGPFVLPAAVLNALPKGRSYTVYLVSGGDMSHCPFDFISSQLQGDFPIADLTT